MRPEPYNKITASVLVQTVEDLKEVNSPSLPEDLMSKLENHQIAFVGIFYPPIANEIGPEDWAVNFILSNQNSSTFYVDIYTDTFEKFQAICSIIKRHADNRDFRYYRRNIVDLNK